LTMIGHTHTHTHTHTQTHTHNHRTMRGFISRMKTR
jgi:hypothetical protein